DDAGNGQVAYFFDMKCFADELATPEEIANEAARRVTARLGADKIDSGHMPVVFSPEMAAGLAGGLAGAANGDMVFKQASFLHDKLGASIAPANFSLIDDPLKYHGTASGAFDGEGVPTRRLPIIEAGKLNLFLYDTYTASKAGTRSTGSAARSYSSLPRIGTSNLYIAPGDVAPEKIVGDVKKGLYVTSMMGRGVDTVTGDYSRGAQGFLIENGELTQPVQEVTVAGNLLEMLPKIDAIGSDLTFRGSTGAPTLRVAEMTVSGR
ncbi:TldD/PmbA family protein, partial [bacterium]|nr:TldD/PmbA family protein [bacterium]